MSSGFYIFTRYGRFISFMLFAAFLAIPCAAEPQEPGIRIQLSRDPHLSLHITLKSLADAEVKIPRGQLPWKSNHSLSLVAVIANGQCLNRDMPVSDPLLDEISIGPGASLSGDIDLERLFPDIQKILDTWDVHLFWAYEAPDALHLPHWSGGWILVPKQK